MHVTALNFNHFYVSTRRGVAELKATFLAALEAARKYLCQLDTENNIIVTCSKAENELY
jgi:hypothetical protein